MKTRRLQRALAGILLIACPQAQAQDSPSISLTGFEGERQIIQAQDDPLLLYVIIDNAAATEAERENARSHGLVEQFVRTEAYAALSEVEKKEFHRVHAIRAIPGFVLGSAAASLESLVRFLAKDSKGQALEIPVAPVAANDHEQRPIDLLDERSILYLFAVTPEALGSLQPGSYQLTATVDTSQRDDMWQGWFYSHPVRLELHATHPDPAWPGSARQHLLWCTWLLKDARFGLAESRARKWINDHPDSVDAWFLLGEALHGQGRSMEALEALHTAEARFREKHGNQPRELPHELLDRIREIEEATP